MSAKKTFKKTFQKLYEAANLTAPSTPPDLITVPAIKLSSDHIFTDTEILEENYDIDSLDPTGEPSIPFNYGKGFSVRFLYRQKHQGHRALYAHLCECEYVKKVSSQSLKYNKFVLTTRYDGYFPIYMTEVDEENHPIETNPKNELKLYKFKLCYACYDILMLWRYGYDRYRFPFKKFHDDVLAGRTQLLDPNLVEKYGTNFEYDKYSSHWGNISRELRKLRGNKCERCGRPASKEVRLEVHHKDRNTLNNLPSNLEVLCSDCHDKEHPNRPRREK